MTDRKSAWKKALPYIIMLVFFVLAPLGFHSRTWLNMFIMIFVSLVSTSSLRTISLSGNMSFAQAAFVGVGAYVSGVMGKELGWSIFLTIPVGALAAMLLGLVTGWPFARLRSIYFCMGSMFMGVAITLFISSFSITGGALGLRGIPTMSGALKSIFGDLSGIAVVRLSYYLILLVTLFSLVCLYRFEHSRIGWTLRALSQSPDVAASIGISEKFYRLLSVGVGCFFAGLIGAVYGHYNTTLSPNNYGMGVTLWLIMYMMIGGQNDFLGPIVGATLLELLQQAPTLMTAMSGKSWAGPGMQSLALMVGKYSAYSPFLTAAVLLVMAYFIPGGLVSIPSRIRERKAQRRAAALEAAGTEGGGNDAA